MRKIILMLAISACAALSVSAGNYNYLTILKQDGTQQSFTALGLTITFADGNMTATQDGQTTTMSLSELNKMYFSQTSGIENVQEAKVRNQTSGAVYDLSGRKVAQAPHGSQVPTSLKKGVYIVNGKKVVITKP